MKFLLPIQKQYPSAANPNCLATDIFCVECLMHERHFKGGHSWSPDLCPCGCEDTIVWHEMGPIQKLKAQFVYYENEKKERIK